MLSPHLLPFSFLLSLRLHSNIYTDADVGIARGHFHKPLQLKTQLSHAERRSLGSVNG